MKLQLKIVENEIYKKGSWSDLNQYIIFLFFGWLAGLAEWMSTSDWDTRFTSKDTYRIQAIIRNYLYLLLLLYAIPSVVHDTSASHQCVCVSSYHALYFFLIFTSLPFRSVPHLSNYYHLHHHHHASPDTVKRHENRPVRATILHASSSSVLHSNTNVAPPLVKLTVLYVPV